MYTRTTMANTKKIYRLTSPDGTNLMSCDFSHFDSDTINILVKSFEEMGYTLQSPSINKNENIMQKKKIRTNIPYNDVSKLILNDKPVEMPVQEYMAGILDYPFYKLKSAIKNYRVGDYMDNNDWSIAVQDYCNEVGVEPYQIQYSITIDGKKHTHELHSLLKHLQSKFNIQLISNTNVIYSGLSDFIYDLNYIQNSNKYYLLTAKSNKSHKSLLVITPEGSNDYISNNGHEYENCIFVNSMNTFFNSEQCRLDFESHYQKYVSSSDTIKIKSPNENVANFDIVVSTQQGLKLHTMSINYNDKCDIDLHYAPMKSKSDVVPFSVFDGKLKHTLTVKDKGLCIFTGPPGTGKTNYIKRLAYELRESHRFIIVKSNVISQLDSPNFQTFLIENVVPYNEAGIKVCLVIEDSEELIKSREDGQVPGISNLLNYTDGIDSDMYKIQVICSANTDINKIDSALKRPGRLITAKEFTSMEIEQAKKLFEHIKEYRNIEGDYIFDVELIKDNMSSDELKHIENGYLTVSHVYKMFESQDPDILSGHIDIEDRRKKVGFQK